MCFTIDCTYYVCSTNVYGVTLTHYVCHRVRFAQCVRGNYIAHAVCFTLTAYAGSASWAHRPVLFTPQKEQICASHNKRKQRMCVATSARALCAQLRHTQCIQGEANLHGVCSTDDTHLKFVASPACTPRALQLARVYGVRYYLLRAEL